MLKEALVDGFPISMNNLTSDRFLMVAAITALCLSLLFIPGFVSAKSSPGLENVDASSARWAAWGAYFANQAESAAALSTARYQGLAESYQSANNADTARWTAWGSYFLAQAESAAALSTARYEGLAQHYTLFGVAPNVLCCAESDLVAP